MPRGVHDGPRLGRRRLTISELQESYKHLSAYQKIKRLKEVERARRYRQRSKVKQVTTVRFEGAVLQKVRHCKSSNFPFVEPYPHMHCTAFSGAHCSVKRCLLSPLVITNIISRCHFSRSVFTVFWVVVGGHCNSSRDFRQ